MYSPVNCFIAKLYTVNINEYKYNKALMTDSPGNWSHSAIYIIFVLGTINAMMNIKQFIPIVLICAETKWPGS